MTRPQCWNECFTLLRKMSDQTGVDLAVGVCPDHVVAPPGFQPTIMRCPHEVRWLIEPTGDQLAQWAADGTL